MLSASTQQTTLPDMVTSHFMILVNLKKQNYIMGIGGIPRN